MRDECEDGEACNRGYTSWSGIKSQTSPETVGKSGGEYSVEVYTKKLSHLLSDFPDVIRFKSTTSSDISDSKIVSFPGISSAVKPGKQPGL